MPNESDPTGDYLPPLPTGSGRSDATRRLEAILAEYRQKPDEAPPTRVLGSTTKAELPEWSPEYIGVSAQLAALVEMPEQEQYVLDCAALGLNGMDGEESVRALLVLWKKIQRPRGKIQLCNASAALLASLQTKNLLDGIFQAAPAGDPTESSVK